MNRQVPREKIAEAQEIVGQVNAYVFFESKAEVSVAGVFDQVGN